MKSNTGFKHSFIISIISFILIVIIVMLCISRAENKYHINTQNATKEAIMRSIVSCYAIEGIYPPDIKYLKDHYGLSINDDKYVVYYEIFGSNMMPNVDVIAKK